MRAKNCCAALVAAAIVGGVGTGLPGGFGVGEAVAAPGQTRIYTRKRVHGRWITGRFTSRVEAASTRSAAAEKTAARARPTAAGREREASSQASAPAPRPPERFAALQKDPAEVAPESPASTASPQPDPTSRRGMLQRALETRAHELAHVPKAAEPRASQPRSVSFDFESGLKTTVFPDDRVVREGFDVAAARALASKPPEGPALSAPKP